LTPTRRDDSPRIAGVGDIMRVSGARLAHFLHRLKLVGLMLVGLLGGALLLLAARWPFTRAATIESLERISSSEVRVSHFRRTFLPRPGYIAEGVTFARGVRMHMLFCRRPISPLLKEFGWTEISPSLMPILRTQRHRVKQTSLAHARWATRG
jgi:hypothetical protein